MDPTALFAVAIGIVLFALVSRRAQAGVISAPMVFTGFGFLVGGAVLGLFEPPLRGAGIEALAEITLVLALFTDAARIDLRRLGREHDVPLRLLGVGLPLCVIAGTGAAMLLFPAMPLWSAALIGVMLAPTDAALGQAVVTDPRVPHRIRQALNVESGLNDGLAFPALLLAASLAGAGAARDLGIGGDAGTVGWAAFILGQVILGPLVGIAIGLGGAWAIERANARDWMDAAFLRISTLALAILAFAGAEAVGGNGFIAAFAGGLAVGTRGRQVLDAVEDFGETEGQLLTLSVFLLFGAILLPDLAGIGLRHLLYAALSLTVLRMVPVGLSLAGTRLRLPTVLFLGWFGPRGLASIIYLLLVLEGASDVPGIDDVQLTVLVTVLGSVLLHGATAAPLARLYGAWAARDDTAPEHRAVSHFPVRLRSLARRARGGR